VDQISGTTPTDAPVAAPGDGQPTGGDQQSEIGQPGFGTRGRARRRARFLRKARELAYRDLGGLVFNLHRFGQRNDALVLAKLTTLGQIDTELRTLEAALAERQAVTVLREAGITACARCAAIHGSEDRFCPNCGLSLDRRVDLPAGFQSAAAPAPAPAPSPPASPPGPPASAPGPPAPAPGASPPAPRAPSPTPDAAPGDPAAAPAANTAAAPPAGTQAPPPASAPPPSTRAAPAPARAPKPPPAAAPPAQPASGSSGGDESTEILRPPAVGT